MKPRARSRFRAVLTADHLRAGTRASDIRGPGAPCPGDNNRRVRVAVPSKSRLASTARDESAHQIGARTVDGIAFGSEHVRWPWRNGLGPTQFHLQPRYSARNAKRPASCQTYLNPIKERQRQGCCRLAMQTRAAITRRRIISAPRNALIHRRINLALERHECFEAPLRRFPRRIAENSRCSPSIRICGNRHFETAIKTHCCCLPAIFSHPRFCRPAHAADRRAATRRATANQNFKA